jgi:hypothetical protein
MEGSNQEDEHGGISTRAMEIATALAIMGLGALVMYDSHRLGASWAADGPRAGYFPFYVGLLMFGASVIVLAQAVLSRRPRRNFIDVPQFKSVLALMIPTTGYVVVTFFLGIYVASAVYLAYFMRVLGNYRIAVIAPIAIGVPVLLFFLFEIWFLVPLPKGPVEALFGR